MEQEVREKDLETERGNEKTGTLDDDAAADGRSLHRQETTVLLSHEDK